MSGELFSIVNLYSCLPIFTDESRGVAVSGRGRGGNRRGGGARGGAGRGQVRGGSRGSRGGNTMVKAIALNRPRCVGALKHTPDPERLKGFFSPVN